ncbi:MAG: 50S ribosomal protein L4 [Myxococcales bacterium]|nr:50S ribosomal protein L4 [Myxococcales bacterium]USN50891.1 MAG: 50S ribosomal protein L4 [Myxococcales bacterium]
MATFEVFNFAGEKISQAELEDSVFGAEVRPYLHSEVVNWQRACGRAGTQSVLTKAEVAGTTKKPFPQKGRGCARQGSGRKNPHQKGGGVAFAPKPRDYSFSMPKSKKRAALASVITARIQEGRFRLLDELSFPEPKTKRVCELLGNFKMDSCLLIDEDNNKARLSSRNHQGVKFLKQEGINVADVLRYPYLIMTVNAAKNLEKRLVG